jgi:hypothetical protein
VESTPHRSVAPRLLLGPAMTSVSFAITLWLEIKDGSGPL